MAASAPLKLGLLVLAGMAAAAAVVFGLGLRRAPSVTYHTYFDESVQGLEVGALVKYRGVKIGRVADIEIAPDRRHVAVDLSIERDRAHSIGLTRIASTVRARLAILGITGLKIVDLEVVDPSLPVPELPFSPEQPYLPSQPSLLVGIERGLKTGVPELIEAAISALDRLEVVLDDVHSQHLTRRIGAAADATTRTVTKLERTIAGLDGSRKRVDKILDRVGGNDGLVASARRATDALGDVGRNTRASSNQLERTLRELGDAARSVRAFVDDLARQPDMLFKGRGRRP